MGNKAAHFGNITVDAKLYDDESPNTRSDHETFQVLYGNQHRNGRCHFFSIRGKKFTTHVVNFFPRIRYEPENYAEYYVRRPSGQIPIIYQHDEIHRALMKAKALMLDNEKAI